MCTSLYDLAPCTATAIANGAKQLEKEFYYTSRVIIPRIGYVWFVCCTVQVKLQLSTEPKFGRRDEKMRCKKKDAM